MKTILAVDDSATMREMVAFVLESAGYRVIEAEDGAQGLDRAAATGEAYLPEQVYGVLETQLAYLRSIGAVGPPADDDRDAR